MPRLSRKTKQFSFWRLIVTAVVVLLTLVLINTLWTGVLGLAEQAEQTEQTGKHTVTIFTAPGWCGPCRQLESDPDFQRLLTDCRANPDCKVIRVDDSDSSNPLINGQPVDDRTGPELQKYRLWLERTLKRQSRSFGYPTIIVDDTPFVGDQPEMRQALIRAAQPSQPPVPPPDSDLVPIPPFRPSPQPQPQPPSSSQPDDVEKQIKQIQDVMMKTGKALNKWRLEKSPEERQKLEEQANQMLVLADKAIKLLEAKRGVLKLLEEMEKQMDKIKDDSAKLEQMEKARQRAEKILKDISEKLAKLTPSPPSTPPLSPAPTPPYPSTPQPQPQPLPQPGSIMSLEELNDFTRRGNPIPLGQLMRTSDGRIWRWNGTGWDPAR